MKKILSIIIALFLLIGYSENQTSNNYTNFASNKKSNAVQKNKTQPRVTSTPSSYEQYMKKSIHLKNKVVSSNLVDYNYDGIKEEIKIVLDKGYFNEDKEMWSGRGPKWVGKFSIHTFLKSKEIFKMSLSKLIYTASCDTMFLYSPEFKLKFHDYNHDGNLDFVLMQYYSTNGCEYYPFTIKRNGKIEKLGIQNKLAFFISPMSTINSIILPLEGDKIITSYYDNTKGAYFRDYYVWSQKKKKFVVEKHETAGVL